MDIEQKQAEIIDLLVKRGSTCKGEVLVPIIVEATSHPYLFAFSEILALPTVAQLQGTTNSLYLNLLRLFAHGTWSDYKGIATSLPQLAPAQILKLKQLTLLTLAESNKVLPYDTLMAELDVTNVRELEDFLIYDCMYAGIVRGKLDSLKRCFEVPFAAGRDLRPGQLGNMIHTLSNWLNTSENLLVSIQDKIKWAGNMSEMDKKHSKEVEEEVKKSLSMKVSDNKTEKQNNDPVFIPWDYEGLRLPDKTDTKLFIDSIKFFLKENGFCGQVSISPVIGVKEDVRMTEVIYNKLKDDTGIVTKILNDPAKDAADDWIIKEITEWHEDLLLEQSRGVLVLMGADGKFEEIVKRVQKDFPTLLLYINNRTSRNLLSLPFTKSIDYLVMFRNYLSHLLPPPPPPGPPPPPPGPPPPPPGPPPPGPPPPPPPRGGSPRRPYGGRPHRPYGGPRGGPSRRPYGGPSRRPYGGPYGGHPRRTRGGQVQ